MQQRVRVHQRVEYDKTGEWYTILTGSPDSNRWRKVRDEKWKRKRREKEEKGGVDHHLREGVRVPVRGVYLIEPLSEVL